LVVVFTQPQGVDPAVFPIYSGFIEIQGGQQTVHVPYLGVAASMIDLPIIDASKQYLSLQTPTILDGTSNVQSGPRTYTLNGTDAPTVLYRLAGGTPSIYIDLVDPSTDLGFAPQYMSRKRQSSMMGAGTTGGSFSEVPIVGTVFQDDYVPRK